MLTQDRRWTDALVWWEAAAEQGAVWPMLVLGDWYDGGRSDVIVIDETASTEWYRRAALAGNASGQYNYAVRLMSGTGVAPDEQEAVAWLMAAAAQHERSAYASLSRLYSEGRIVQRDLVEAHALMAAALAQADGDFGDGEAERLQLLELEAQMTEAEIDAARERRDAWLAV